MINSIYIYILLSIYYIYVYTYISIMIVHQIHGCFANVPSRRAFAPIRQEKFRASPPWLRSLSFLARRDLEVAGSLGKFWIFWIFWGLASGNETWLAGKIPDIFTDGHFFCHIQLHTHRIHGAGIYGVPWIPSIYPSHVSIYTSTMDPSWDRGFSSHV